MSVIQVCQIDVAYVLLYDLWSKSLKHTFIAPVHSSQLILGFLADWRGSIFLRFFGGFLLAGSLAFGFDFWRPGWVLSFFSSQASSSPLRPWGMSVCILVLLFGYMADIAAWS